MVQFEEIIDDEHNKCSNIDKDNDNKPCIQVYSHSPEVYTVDNFLTNEECQHMINLTRGNLNKSKVSGNNGGYVSEGRTGLNYWILHNRDSITLNIAKRVAELVRLPLENAESFQMIYYGINQEYKRHYDGWLFDGSEKSRRNMKNGGQRILTALCYLNDVEEGGGTKFPRLNIEIMAKKRRMSVFRNVIENTNKRHILSEHCGMPVIKGEKWGFNLWFREESRLKLYNYIVDSNDLNVESNCKDNIIFSKLNVIDKVNKIYQICDFLSKDDVDLILKNTSFNESKRGKCWINKSKLPNIIKKYEHLLKINQEYFENMFIVNYKEAQIHRNHFDAYDLTSESGKEYTKNKGQRLITVTTILKNTVNYEFINLEKGVYCPEYSTIIYKNVNTNSTIRNNNLEKRITSDNDNTIIFNLYVREKDSKNKKLVYNDDILDFFNKNTENASINNCIYNSTLESVYKKISDGDVFENGYKEMKFNCKVPWNILQDSINQLNKIRKLNNNSILNQIHFLKSYHIDEYNPVIIEDLYVPDAFEVARRYYKENIKNNYYALGDKQSVRFKCHNESLGRILHYELHPLVEKIVNKKLEPTYVYLSCYTKGSDLPAHTDRPDCEYTASFIIDKPDNFQWDIYLHKKKQPKKGTGRSDFTPDKSECIALDTDKNGIMIFQGEDHLHFREVLEAEYYNIILLHFKILN